MGTPAFMSPEQAAARHSSVGPASDVYCLGAILYMLLTGKPPFHDANVSAVLIKIQTGAFDSPRQIRADVPPALEAICLRAMKLKPEERYPDARALGLDIERWLADEPVTAYHEPFRLRARRWAKRHRTWVVAAAVSLTITAVLLGSWRVSVARQRWKQESDARKRLAQREDEARAFMDRASKIAADAEVAAAAEKSRNDAILMFGEAIGFAERAREKLSEAVSPGDLGRVDAVLDHLRQQKSDLGLEIGLEQARLQAVDWENEIDTQAKLSQYDELFHGHGLDTKRLVLDDVAARIKQKTPHLRDFLVAVLDDWAWDLRLRKDSSVLRGILSATAGSADSNKESKEFRDALLEMGTSTQTLVDLALRMDKGREVPATRLHTVGRVLYSIGKSDEAIAFLRAARETHPDDFWINLTLGRFLIPKGPPEYQAADQCLQRALTRQPNTAAPYLALGRLRLRERKSDEAMADFTRAAECAPNYAPAHYAIGYMRYTKHDLAGAIGELRKATEIKPDYAEAHNTLIFALAGPKRDWELAINDYRERVRRDDRHGGNHFGLGTALLANERADQAISEFRAAIKLDPTLAFAYSGLGQALQVKGEAAGGKHDHDQATRFYAEAIQEHKKAIALNPNHPLTRYRLAKVLNQNGDFRSAVDEYRETLWLKPDFVEAHWDLGISLKRQGKFADALGELKRARELGLEQGKPWDDDPEHARELSETSQLVALEPRLPALIKGDVKPVDNRERQTVARWCYEQGHHATAARFWAQVFANDPKSAAALTEGNRYTAACAAALAGTGRGKDDPPLDEQARIALRQQALDWLKADLDAWSAALDSASPDERATAQDVLQRWLGDDDLTGIRDSQCLAKLSSEERAAWQAFWSKVESVQKKDRIESR
jgi:serine/threonine-protein kinase